MPRHRLFFRADKAGVESGGVEESRGHQEPKPQAAEVKQRKKHDGATEGSYQECRHVGGHAAGGRGLRIAGPVEVQHREGEPPPTRGRAALLLPALAEIEYAGERGVLRRVVCRSGEAAADIQGGSIIEDWGGLVECSRGQAGRMAWVPRRFSNGISHNISSSLLVPNPQDVAAYIKKEFDKKYNPTWHCIVGRNFGSYVTHETKHFIYFYLGQVAVLLFKSG